MLETKMARWSRVVRPITGHGLIVPVDHGLTSGGLSGMERSAQLTQALRHPAVTAVVAHKGMIARLLPTGCLYGKGIILQMNGMMSSAAEPHRKELLASVDTALRLGADAVSVELVFDGVHNSHNLALLGALTDQAAPYGLPVLVMAKCLQPNAGSEAVVNGMRRVVRSLWELGADAVKLPKPDALTDIPALLDGLADDIDVFFAGGARSTDDEMQKLLAAGLAAGAKGLCVGRNVFQNEQPGHLLTMLDAQFTRHVAAAPASVY